GEFKVLAAARKVFVEAVHRDQRAALHRKVTCRHMQDIHKRSRVITHGRLDVFGCACRSEVRKAAAEVRLAPCDSASRGKDIVRGKCPCMAFQEVVRNAHIVIKEENNLAGGKCNSDVASEGSSAAVQTVPC